jgi:hypothetical protein
MELTEKNKRAMYKRVDEYAAKGNYPAVIRIIDGAGKTDLEDYVYGEEADAQAGAPNFM